MANHLDLPGHKTIWPEVNIAFSAWHLKNPHVGLGRYCRNLLEALARTDRENEYHILIPKPDKPFPERSNFHFTPCSLPFFKRRVWEQLAPLLLSKCDILHFPYDSSVMIKKCRFIVTIHDLKPRLFPELAGKPNMHARFHRKLVPSWIVQADHISTVSASTKHDLVHHLHIPAEKISVIYPGVDQDLFQPAIRNPSRQTDQPYIMSVAGQDPTKNVGMLLEGFSQLPKWLQKSFELKLVGDVCRRQDVLREVETLGIKNQVTFLGIVEDRRLAQLYQQASLMVFPSLYEGFGFPVLEAMACGCPVICSNTSSLPEVGGQAAKLIDPSNVRELTQAMEQVLTDNLVQQRMREKGIVHARQFSWDRTAKQTKAMYEQVVGQ